MGPFIAVRDSCMVILDWTVPTVSADIFFRRAFSLAKYLNLREKLLGNNESEYAVGVSVFVGSYYSKPFIIGSVSLNFPKSDVVRKQTLNASPNIYAIQYV